MCITNEELWKTTYQETATLGIKIRKRKEMNRTHFQKAHWIAAATENSRKRGRRRISWRRPIVKETSKVEKHGVKWKDWPWTGTAGSNSLKPYDLKWVDGRVLKELMMTMMMRVGLRVAKCDPQWDKFVPAPIDRINTFQWYTARGLTEPTHVVTRKRWTLLAGRLKHLWWNANR